MENQQTTVARINQVNILMLQTSDQLIPIKPICEALGIDAKSQRDKIHEDEDLDSTAVLSTSVGGDGKDREMFCLPLKMVFGWLYTINPKNVKPEAKETVRQYRKECYNALYAHFAERSEFIEQKAELIENALDDYRLHQDEFKGAKSKMYDSRNRLDEARAMDFESWRGQKLQLTLDLATEVN